MSIRIGSGIDVHPLIKGTSFILAGISIKSKYKIEAHSDGDILSHSICDALLGALALGDIGKLFPSSDPKLSGISSLVLLEKVMVLVHEQNAKIINLDATIILQEPKLSEYIHPIRTSLSKVLGISISQISVKATTTDRLGFIGQGKGIGAHCVVLLEID